MESYLMLDAQKSLVDSGSGYPPRLLGKKINIDKFFLDIHMLHLQFSIKKPS